MGLYERIKEASKMKGISINKLEQELGFPKSSISKYNTNSPSIDKLEKIADYLGVSIDYLAKGEEVDAYYLDPEVAEMAQEMATRTELKVLFKASRNMTKEQLEAINNMINAMND